MSYRVTVPLSLDMLRAAREGLINGTGITARLSLSDTPFEFEVEIDPGEQRLTANYRYSTAQEEPRETRLHGRVRVEVGVYSQRLFVLELRPIDLMQVVNATESMGAIVRELQAAFAHLSKSAVRMGPRLNYATAEQGMKLASSPPETPPAWLCDVLTKIRDGRSSRP